MTLYGSQRKQEIFFLLQFLFLGGTKSLSNTYILETQRSLLVFQMANSYDFLQTFLELGKISIISLLFILVPIFMKKLFTLFSFAYETELNHNVDLYRLHTYSYYDLKKDYLLHTPYLNISKLSIYRKKNNFSFPFFSAIFPPGGPMSKEDLTINYGILGGQFHFEKPGAVGPGGHNSGSKYGCYGQPNRETTYYSANAVNGYQTLTRGQFERVAHLFPLR